MARQLLKESMDTQSHWTFKSQGKLLVNSRTHHSVTKRNHLLGPSSYHLTCSRLHSILWSVAGDSPLCVSCPWSEPHQDILRYTVQCLIYWCSRTFSHVPLLSSWCFLVVERAAEFQSAGRRKRTEEEVPPPPKGIVLVQPSLALILY